MTDDLPSRLSNISTIWTSVRDAHRRDVNDAAHQARLELFERYQGAVYRYLLGALGDGDAAEDVFQEFALRLVCGRFANADESKGRFRDYLRTALIHMVTDYHRKQARAPRELAEGQIAELADDVAESSELFDGSWRDELLHLVWQALRVYQETSGNLYHSALQLRVGHPELRSTALAEKLSKHADKPITAAAYRKLVERARDMFAELLVYEVSHSIASSDSDEIEQELQTLNLYSYCQR